MDYLENDQFLLLEIINLTKDKIINFLEETKEKIEFKNSFIINDQINIGQIKEQLDLLVNNNLL